MPHFVVIPRGRLRQTIAAGSSVLSGAGALALTGSALAKALLRASAIGLVALSGGGVGVVAAAATIPQGRQSGYSSGIIYDLHADAVRGNDTTGDGSLANPVATPTKALALAVASGGTKKKIALRGDLGQTYTDIPPTISTDGIEFHGYQTEVPNWEGSYVVTGFAACTSGDADVLGAKWANCYKATFTIAGNLFHTGYNVLLPTENGTLLHLAQLRRDVSDLFVQSDPRLFYSSLKGDDVTITQSGSDLTTISHPSVLGAFTQAQLENMAVMLHVAANKCSYSEVLSAAGTTLTLADGTGLTKETKFGDAYSLLNAGPAIEQGQYVWKVNGDGTLTIYVFPNDPANLAAGIKIAARDNILTFSGSDGNKVSNFRFRYVAGDGSVANKAPVVFDDTTNGQCIQSVFEYYGYKHFNAPNGPGTGPVAVLAGQDNLVQYIDYKYGQNQFGPYFTNNSTVNYTSSNNRMLNCYGYRVTVSPWRFYGETLPLVAANLFEACGVDAHAGKGEMTQACDRGAIVLNEYIGCDGYISIQNDSNIFIALNVIPAPENGDDARAIVDQSNDDAGHAARTSPAGSPSTNYCILNLTPKPESNTGTGASILLTASAAASVNTTMQWYAYGNVGHGLDTSPDPSKLLGSGYGVYTKAATSPQGSDTVVTDANDIFYDASNANWNTVPGSILTSKTSLDMTSIFAVVEGWFPDFDFAKTLNGYPLDRADPRVGPYGAHYPVQVDTTAPTVAFVGSPTITGASASVTVTTNERGGRLYWSRYNGGSAPSGAQVVAGQNGSGGAALSSGSFAVGDPGTQAPFTVTGTAGQTDTLAIAHQDRNGNISTVVTTNLAFAAYSEVWTSMNGVNFPRKSSALVGAQASTRKMIAAIAISRSAAQLTTGVSGGLFVANGSSVAVPTWGTTSTGKLQMIQEQAADTAFANLVVPSSAMPADTHCLLLVCFKSDGSTATMNATLWNIATGAQILSTATQGPTAGDISLKFLNNYDIFKAAATYERFMLWDNPSTASPDATDATLRGYFMSAGALLDPAIAAANLGTPLVSLSDAVLAVASGATVANAGSGGNFTMT